MSQQPPTVSPVGGPMYKGDIYINGHVEGEGIAIGPGAQAHVVKNYFQARLSDTQQQRLVAEVKAEVLAQMGVLANAGFRPEVAPLPRRAEQMATRDPFALPVGVSAPARVPPADAQQWQQTFAPLNQQLQQLDHQLSAATPGERRVARELVIGQERVNLVELLIQQGNLALWSFRQASARLFADQTSAYYLAHPPWPTLPALQAFHDEARRALEVRRAWVLYQKYRIQHPEMTGPFVAQLAQGRWRDVLQAWLATKEMSAEGFQYERAYLKAIGERYDPQAVRNAAQQAESCFAEALRRQPDNSSALVNWAAIKAESALFFSIETGALDRARLQGAQALFRRAEGQLEQRQDREGQAALGLCLLHDATSLPPDANLEAVQWAARRTQQMRQEFKREGGAGAQRPQAPAAAGAAAIQWDAVQRNWARRDGRFFDEAKAKRARQILVAAGAAAALILLCDETLAAHAQMIQQIAHWGGSGLGGQQPNQPQAPAPQTPQQPALKPLQQAAKPARALSRRALLRVGIGGGAVVVVAGSAAIAAKAGAFANLFSPGLTPTATSTATPTAPPGPGTVLATHQQGSGVNSLGWAPGSGASLRSGYRTAPAAGGLRIASAGQDGTVAVWDPSTGKTLLTYRGHTGAVLAVAWSPDGTRLASGGADRSVQVWDAATGKTLATYSGHDAQINALAWSPDGQRLASGDAVGILQVASADGQPLYTAQGTGFQEILALAWSPDGTRIAGGGGYFQLTLAPGGGLGTMTARAAGESGLVEIWDAGSGRPVNTYLGHAATVRAVNWSPDSNLIASGGEDTTVQIWQPGDRASRLAYKNHTGPVNTVAWSADGARILSGSDDRTVQVWGATDGNQLFSFTRQRAPVRAAAWSPDGQEIASGGDDQTVQVWRAP